MGVQGELGVKSANAPYGRVHGGLKILSEEIIKLEVEVSTGLPAPGEVDTLRFKAKQATAHSKEVKHWLEHNQSMGRDTEIRKLQQDATCLHDKINFLEMALTQVLRFVTTLKDTIEGGGGWGRIGFRQDTGPSPGASGPFVTQAALETHMHTVQVALESFSQEMKGAPLEFGGVSFHGLDSCIAWARTHMPVATYQCIPGMFYGLCLIREMVLYKEDMRDDNIQAHQVKRSLMQSAMVELVNTAVLSIMEGPKTNALKDPKYKFGALKTFAAWKPTDSQGGALGRLKDGLEAAWQ